MGRRWKPQWRQIGALVLMATRYWLTIAIQVRRELSRWERRARQIPDPVLRDQALRKLREEHLNAEAAATFATLGTWRAQRRAVRLMVAFEVMYDYLDLLSEQPSDDVLQNGLQLHRALIEALDVPGGTRADFYAKHRQRDDGGYLPALAATCRTSLARMPGAIGVKPVLSAAVRRCGEAQSRTHAVPFVGVEQLEGWARPPAARLGWHWWEWAAGATASLSVHALFAAATRRQTSIVDAAAIDAAYTPAICALATLMDSLVDLVHDDPGQDHSYVEYYGSTPAVMEGVSSVARRALSQASSLPRGARHEVIVVGITCFYLSSAEAAGGVARQTAESLLAEVGGLWFPTLALLRGRRRIVDRRGFFLRSGSQ